MAQYLSAMFRSVGRSFLDLLYPPVCIHCQESLGPGQERLLCRQCLHALVLIDPEERCPFCFSEKELAKLAACLECRRHPPKWDGFAFACDYMGPARTLLNSITSGDRPYLADGAGAMIAAQFVRLEWPFPDFIIPIPIIFWRSLELGFHPNLLLAKSVGSILDRPVENVLRIKNGAVHVKQSLAKDKTILLISDLMTSKNYMKDCAEVLACERPRALYGMTFSK